MKNRFLIYAFQFDRNDGQEKAYNTTMIGEVKPSEDTYKGLTDAEAVDKRIRSELDTRKNRGCEQDYGHMVNLNVFEFWAEREKGADKLIHAELERKGYERIYIKKYKDSNKESTTEEFNFNEESEKFATIIYDIIRKLENKSPDKVFIPRSKQDEVMQKMLKAFKEEEYKKFLLGAICRFGKTATILHFFTKLLPKDNILMITAKCDAFKSWEEDYMNFISRDWSLLTKKNILENDKPFGKKNIAVVSFQSAAKDYEDNEEDAEIDEDEAVLKSLGKKLSEVKWDAVIVDECHFGSSTQRSKGFLKKIVGESTLVIDVSATPYKKIAEGEYNRENAFIYDLIDEAKDNEGIKDYSKYVPVYFYHLDFGSAGINIESFLNRANSDRIKFAQAEKFKACLKLLGPEDVMFDFRAYFEQFDPQTIGYHFSSMYDKIFSKTGKNFAVFVNNISHGKKLEDALKPLDKFEVINVCGNSRKSIDRLNVILNSSPKPVIIISCGRDLTGVTLEKLHGLIIMGTLHSAENYMQFSLRGKNTYAGRDFPCSVFDLNTLSFIQTNCFIDYIESRAQFTMQTTSQVIEEAKCFEIFEVNDFGVIELCGNIAEQIKEAFIKFNKSSSSVLSYVKDLMSDKNLLEEIVYGLSNVELLSQGNSTIEITEDMTAGKVQQIRERTGDGSPSMQISRAELNRAVEKMCQISNIIPHFMFIRDISHINEISRSQKLQDAFFIWTDAEWNSTMQIVHDYLEQKGEIYRWEELNDKFCEAKEV